MLKKLKLKFVIINLTIITLLLFVIFGLIYHFTARSLEAESISMMRTIAGKPMQPHRPNEPSADVKLPFFTLQLDQKGQLIYADSDFYDLSDKTFLNDLIRQTNTDTRDSGVIREQGLRYLREHSPMGTTLVFSDMSSESRTLGSLIRSMSIIGFVIFFVFLGISILLARWAVRPVAKAWQQQKQFVADASHELKTPLTVIMTNTDLLMDSGYTARERTQFVQSIALMSAQMRLLVEKMLVLARSDHQDQQKSMQTIDLSNLVTNSALSFEGVFLEKGLTLESSIEEGLHIHGNEDIQQVIDILLDNAQKYASPDSCCEISLRRSDHRRCRIKVSNPGAQIPAEDLKQIFQRFYRADKSRSRDGSFGLGLSIAENIVTRHGGKIWAESRDGINSFFVELKLCHH